MTTIPSLRRMWTMYKKLLVEDGATRRDQILAQGAFYSGARCVLKVLDHLAEAGELSHPVAAAVLVVPNHKRLAHGHSLVAVDVDAHRTQEVRGTAADQSLVGR